MELSHQQAVIRLADIKAELERLGAKDELTVEDEQSFDELTREFGEVNDHRRQLERTSALERVRAVSSTTARGPAALAIERGTAVSSGGSAISGGQGYDADPILNPDSIEDCRFRDPWDLSQVRTFGRDPEEVSTELRSRAISAIEKMPGANDAVREGGTKILER